MHKLKRFIAVLMIFIVVYLFTTSVACVYHKADIVYPCDTTVVRYSVEITAILNDNCRNCHGPDPSENVNSFGINLYDFATIHFYATDTLSTCTNNQLLSAITQQDNCVPLMPKGQPKLNDCSINKFIAWVNSGAPDN